jgi:hypothetical protein
MVAPPRLFARTLLVWLAASAAVHAAPTQEQIRTALGSPPELTWEITGTGSWNVDDRGLSIYPVPYAVSVHGLETTVTGPGVANLTIDSGGLDVRSVWVDDVRSGIEGWGGYNSVHVGPGTHRLRWAVSRSATSESYSPPVTCREATWQPYRELPLAVGANGSVTLTSPGKNPWIGQDRLHHGDGGGAWSGLKVAPTTPATDASLIGDFDGPGVLVFRSKVGGDGMATYKIDAGSQVPLSPYGWARVRVPVETGHHRIEWRADLGSGITWRPSLELAVDEVALLPYVNLSEALDTPGWVWTTKPGYDNVAPYGIPDATARGGSMVAGSWLSELSTPLAGSQLLKVRSRGQLAPEVFIDDAYAASAALPPTADGWQDQLHELPDGEGMLRLVLNHGTEVDFVEILPVPTTIDAALGVPGGSITTDGSSVWRVAPYAEMAGYGASITSRRGEGRSWMELPVTGPATLRFDWKSRDHNADCQLLVDGKPMAVVSHPQVSETVHIEVPAGSHSVRWQVDAPINFPTSFTVSIANLSLTPLGAEASAMTALGLTQPVSLAGEWKAGSTFGRAALESPAAGSTGNQWSSDHEIRAHFRGPGLLKFRWYLGIDPASGYTASWRLENPASGELWLSRDSYEGIDGWREASVWLPPGGTLLEWSVSGSPEEASLAALADVVFIPDAPLSLGDAVEAPQLIWTTDPATPWLGVNAPSLGDDVALSPPLVKGASAKLATTLQGPGRLSYRWRDFDTTTSRVWGKVSIAGQVVDESSWRDDGEIVEVMVPFSGPVTVDWIASVPDWIQYPDDFIGVDSVTWEPSKERPLAASLDTAKAKVSWKSSTARSFTGRDDAGALGGSSAYTCILPGEESWLEATVNGPGLFDFWLREIEGSDLSGNPWDYWSLTIDGKPVAVDGTTTWEPFWIAGNGPHRIRLTLRIPEIEQGDRQWLAGAVDEVSWQPMKRVGLNRGGGLPRLNWKSNSPLPPTAFSRAGRQNKPAIVLNTLGASDSWVETKVQGPCELSWDSALSGNWAVYREARNSLQIDGTNVIPMTAHPWQRMRLTLPSGPHSIRWQCEPYYEGWEGSEDVEEFPVALNAMWRIGNVSIRRGASKLSAALDVPELFALETGDDAGSTVTVAGEDAWQPAPRSSLYFFHPGRTGKLHTRWGHPGKTSGTWRVQTEDGYGSDLTSEGNEWEPHVSLLKPGGFCKWTYDGSDPAFDTPLLASLSIDSSPVREIAEALESVSPIEPGRWVGLEDDSAPVGSDSAWSFLDGLGYNYHHVAETTVTGPARLSFWWKRQGSSTLTLSLDGALLPVPPAAETWTQVEIAVNPGSHVVSWSHYAGPGTSSISPSEAWLDALLLTDAAGKSLDQAASIHPAVQLSTHDDAPLSWHPVAHAEADGSWTEAVRAVSGSRVLKTTVNGPAVLTFHARAFTGLPAPVIAQARARSTESSTGGFPGGGGVYPTVLAHFLAVHVDGNTVSRLDSTTAGAWQEMSVQVPEGSHEISFQLMGRFYSWLFREYEAESTQPDLQGWLDDFRLQPIASPPTANNPQAAGHQSPGSDADHDGANDDLEYWFGTAPRDPSSVPPALEVHAAATSEPDAPPAWLMIPYLPLHASGAVLEASSDLVEWQPLEVDLLHEPLSHASTLSLPRATTTHYPWVIPPGGSQQYFRLRFPDLAD